MYAFDPLDVFFLFSIILDQHHWPGLVLFSHSVIPCSTLSRETGTNSHEYHALAVVDTNGRQLQAKNKNKVKGSEKLGVVPDRLGKEQ